MTKQMNLAGTNMAGDDLGVTYIVRRAAGGTAEDGWIVRGVCFRVSRQDDGNGGWSVDGTPYM